MIVRALDAGHDWEFGKGRNDYKKNREAVAQNIQTRLYSFLGDCFFAANDGIDWFNLLGGKNKITIELSVSATILNTLYVTGIKQLSIVLSSVRELTIQYEVDTSFGAVSAESNFIPDEFLLTEGGDTIVTEEGNEISV